ncbi:DUF808 domain-containing protein [Aliikangiella sp. IMCC44653]
MAGSSLLTLLDDIATVLDDVAVLSKVAAKKTAGVLGDDLALNAEQVSGIKAERELPVVWAVAKGSMLNKFILVPAALLISVFLPILINPLLMIGGAYLCYEGIEKIAHHLMHKDEVDKNKQQVKQALADPKINMVEFESKKIKGAIRTDFILSAEIIVISLGTVSQAPFATQAMVVSAIAIFMTVAVYGLVAAIVKLDDAGFYLVAKKGKGALLGIYRWIGRRLLAFAPFLMKSLSVIGTAAMFLVGGGILLHGLHFLDLWVKDWQTAAAAIDYIGGVIKFILPSIVGVVVGILTGIICLLLVNVFARFKKTPSNEV